MQVEKPMGGDEFIADFVLGFEQERSRCGTRKCGEQADLSERPLLALLVLRKVSPDDRKCRRARGSTGARRSGLVLREGLDPAAWRLSRPPRLQHGRPCLHTDPAEGGACTRP